MRLISNYKTKVLLLFASLLGSNVKYPLGNDGDNNDPNSKVTMVDSEFAIQLDQHFRAKLDGAASVGAAILVMKGNQVIYEGVFGKKQSNVEENVTPNTLFRIGSVSKGFAGLLAAKLTELKIISLEDPVSKFIPELTLKANTIDRELRIKHILSHTTGLTQHAHSDLIDKNYSYESILSYLNKVKPRDLTGITYAYQNAAFGLIEKVIENATGKTYEQALDYYLLSPLEMCQTNCSYSCIKNNSDACVGHVYTKKGAKPIDIGQHYYQVASAGGINATIRDMQKWLPAIMGYRQDVISDYARQLAFTPFADTSRERKLFNRWPGVVSTHYGLGWRILYGEQNQLIYHGGLVNGFKSEIAFDKNDDIGIVVMFNSYCNYSNWVVPEFFEMWNQYNTTKTIQDTLVVTP